MQYNIMRACLLYLRWRISRHILYVDTLQRSPEHDAGLFAVTSSRRETATGSPPAPDTPAAALLHCQAPLCGSPGYLCGSLCAALPMRAALVLDLRASDVRPTLREAL